MTQAIYVSNTNIDRNFSEKLAAHRKPLLGTFAAPDLRVSNEQFSDILDAFPNLEYLTVDGSDLTVIDLRQSPKLDALTLERFQDMDQIRFAEKPPSSIWMFSENFRPFDPDIQSYWVGGPGFDRETLQQLLDTAPTTFTVVSRIKDIQSIRGLNFQNFKSITFVNNVFPIDVFKSWICPPDFTFGTLAMNGPDPIPSGLITAIHGTLAGINVIDLRITSNETDGSTMYRSRMDSLELYLDGRPISVELLEEISKLQRQILLSLDRCTLTDDAVAMLEKMSSVKFVSLVGATYDQDILDKFVEESETTFILK